MRDISRVLEEEFKLKYIHIQNTVQLIDDGNTIPFIARYRKEMTGELDDQVLVKLSQRLAYLRNLEQRKETIMKSIDEQGKMTDELKISISNAISLQELEDIHRPYKQKKRTRAMMAREKGLEPLASILREQDLFTGDIESIAAKFLDLDLGVDNIEDALKGAKDIIAEEISDEPKYRNIVRESYLYHGTITSKTKKQDESVYEMYNNFSEKAVKIPSHRLLAISRGEKEGFLSVKIESDDSNNIEYLKTLILKRNDSITSVYVDEAIEDSYSRLIVPSVSNEVMNTFFEKASEQAITVFEKNLKQLLLLPPMRGKVVLGLDPAYRTGCKIAIVDETGSLLKTDVIYPTPPQSKVEESKKIVKKCISDFKVDAISIGNGTASKESTVFVAELIKEIDRKVSYTVVSEAGASVYSASKVAAEEFPDLNVSLRSAISIARRLQDPLAELVKIDPRSIGVGQYQHDMNQKRLSEALSFVVESCVNSIGVDINTASPSLLSYISGIGPGLAKNIVEYRENEGRFKNRAELLKIKKLGKKAFEQCAGFLRISDGTNILDNTSVHPESYQAAKRLLDIMGYTIEEVKKNELAGLEMEIKKSPISEISNTIGIGVPTLVDISRELSKPGRDPRDESVQVKLMKELLDINDLKTGMVLMGTVRNVVDFGAFVDIGVHQDGLVHISQLSNSFVKDPMDIVSVGDVVKVRILEVDTKRKRISLSMKQK